MKEIKISQSALSKRHSCASHDHREYNQLSAEEVNARIRRIFSTKMNILHCEHMLVILRRASLCSMMPDIKIKALISLCFFHSSRMKVIICIIARIFDDSSEPRRPKTWISRPAVRGGSRTRGARCGSSREGAAYMLSSILVFPQKRACIDMPSRMIIFSL